MPHIVGIKLAMILALVSTMGHAFAQKVGPEFLVNSCQRCFLDVQEFPSVAQLANGTFVATFQSFPLGGGPLFDGDDAGVVGQRYGPRGGPIGGWFWINKYKLTDQELPAVAGLADGTFVVAFRSNRQTGTGPGIYGRRFNARGRPLGGDFFIGTIHPSFSHLRASVAAFADGGFVVTWTSVDERGAGVFGRRYGADGEPRGGAFQVNTYTKNHQRGPSIAALADGGFVVTWTSSGQDGSVDGVYGQRYARTGAPRGGEFRVNTSTTPIKTVHPLRGSLTAVLW